MIEIPKIDNNLLEELQEELAPRMIGNCGHTPQLSKETVASLYHALSDYLTKNSDGNLTNDLMQSLGEVP